MIVKYKTELENVKEFILQINSKLKEIEVKGDSVEKLFVAELMIKQLYEGLEEVKDNAKEEAT